MQIPNHVETRLRELAEHGKTLNCYIYDTGEMRKKIAHLARIMPAGVEVFYAMKANPHGAFLAAALEAGAKGIEIASLGEAEKAVAAGFDASSLIYTGPGKSAEELTWAVEHCIRTVHIESLTEAHRLNAIAEKAGKKQDILLRINADFDIHEAQTTFSGGSKKFGVDEEKLADVLPQILALDALNFRGLHVYAASGVLNVADLLKNCELVFGMARHIEATFPGALCDTIDFGGGFGVDYLESGHDFDPQAYADGLKSLIDQYGYQERTFFLELGRYLAADSGWFCTEILDIKDSRGKKQVICAGGINHFRRPAALAINHPLAIVHLERARLFDGQESIRNESVYFGGPLCTGADKLANNIHVEAADIGDIAVFGLAGAYGLTMSNMEFLSHERPEEIVLG
ncbi:diaminopimelate decarboxylase [Mariprofundus ferrinatatus]|uniref:Diaminopimelate decarboxylase n=1 Tax=Mariprofundus ferrinatatus TaxID=1921087 RepID=A0A2K8L6B3_9PROT|nr:alanine racemase [Mariprofundus ferrinatatus]ATX82858.1 diaminopimelate decarboxylase [Mariprofundus ferrinatatus]